MGSDVEVHDLEQVFKNSAVNQVMIDAAKNVAEKRMALLESQGELIRAYDPSDKAGWPLVINTALSAGLTEGEILRELGASPSTLHRWINDGIAPREGVRKLMVRALLELLNDKIVESGKTREKFSAQVARLG